MQKRRVVVTGMGCLTPIGNTVDSFWESLLAGKSGASTITTFDVTDMPVKFSASVKNFEVDKYLDTKEQRKMDLFLQYGMAAAIDAVKDSGIDSDKISVISIISRFARSPLTIKHGIFQFLKSSLEVLKLNAVLQSRTLANPVDRQYS